jgi:hypothetical protein
VFGRIVAMAGIRETSAFRRVHEAASADPGAIFEMKCFVNAFPDSGNFSDLVGKNWTRLTQSEHLKLQNVTNGGTAARQEANRS